jgi:hypothetical protein
MTNAQSIQPHKIISGKRNAVIVAQLVWPRVWIPVGARDFVVRGFRSALEPTQLPIQRVLGFFLVVKWLGCEINHSHLVPRLRTCGFLYMPHDVDRLFCIWEKKRLAALEYFRIYSSMDAFSKQ